MKYTKCLDLVYANNLDGSKIIYTLHNVEIIEPPFMCDTKKWYMKVKLGIEDANNIINFEESFKKTIPDYSFQHAVHNSIIIIKIPFRYKKFECIVLDKDGYYSSCYELEKHNNVSVKISHACFSFQNNKNVLSTWKTDSINII
jgi:hypothetical protein